MHTHNRAQAGIILLEALLGILIFSLGILSMVAMQARAVSTASDARIRSEATAIANQIVSQMWITVDRSSAANLATSLNSFRYNITGTNCSFTGGTVTTNGAVTDWKDGAIAQLPGATATMQQILVDTSLTGQNLATVTVCWQAPADTQVRRHILTANIN